MARGSEPDQAPLPLAVPAQPDIDLSVCAYWGEEACGRPSTFVIHAETDPIPTCDLHVGQQVGWQVYRSRQENTPLYEIAVRARS